MKKCQSNLCTIGGFVVGSAALCALLQSIPERTSRHQGVVRGSSGPTKLSRDVTTGPQVDDDMYEWVREDSTLISLADNTQHHVEPPQLSRRTNLFSSGNDEVGFRMKLYWKTGYFWQESTRETFWCMSCGSNGSCKEGQMMYLSNCKTKTEADAKFQVVSEKRGNRYEVVGTNLCLQKLGRSRKIALKQCKRNMSLQQFQRSRSDDKFDLRPIRARGRCLTNHHHPKAGELVYAESCRKAHRTKTGYWSKY